MDKFVTRAPTWKTKTFNSVLHSAGSGGSKMNKKTTSKDMNKNKPKGVLKPLQDAEVGLSTHDERLLKILSAQPDQPLVEYNGSDSGCSSSSDHFAGAANEVERDRGIKQEPTVTENTPPAERVETNSSFIYGSSNNYRSTAVTQQQVVEHYKTPQNAMSSTSESDMPFTSPLPLDNRLLMRIQRDLNSPSASLRVRALKAIQSPARSVYTQFDIPHAEQKLITDEDRRPAPPKSIQELMRSIIVYVEVRTGEDNRSAGVKKVISALGAKVNDKLLRDTTHVIFKDGLLSTYKKAKQWNIPVVSILWIEACKNQGRICDANLFPISNIDRYENPEIYEKFKRHKSMQPDSEANKRIRVKTTATTPKTPRTGAPKKTSTVVSNTPTTLDSKKKTDISRYFTQLCGDHKSATDSSIQCEKPLMLTSSHQKNVITAESNGTEVSEKNLVRDNRDQKPAETEISAHKNVLSCGPDTFEDTPKTPKLISNKNRSNTTLQPSIETTTTRVAEISLDKSTGTTEVAEKASVPFKVARRRTSIRTLSNINTTEQKATTINSPSKNKERNTMSTNETPTSNIINTPTRRARNRKTTYTPKPLDISEESESIKIHRPLTRRRTLFTSNTSTPHPNVPQDTGPPISNQSTIMEMGDTTTIKSTTPASRAQVDETMVLQTPPQQTDSLLDQHAATTVFSSTRLPGRRRTLFDVSMDIITQRLQNINQSARRSIARPNGNDLERLAQSPTFSSAPTEGASAIPNILSVKRINIADAKPPTEDQTNMDECGDATVATNDKSSESIVTAPKKKRKLFFPNECLITPPTNASCPAVGSKTTPGGRRRRTLMPLVQTELKSAIASPPAAAASISNKLKSAPRRSTLDFEEVRKPNSTLSSLTKFTGGGKSAKPKQNQQSQSESVSAIAEGHTMTDCNSKSPVLVYTNMHKEQSKVIKEAVGKLGGFRIEDNVSDATTHLISLEPRRTMNMLRALLRGLWIVEYTWIKDSLNAGKWLNEEPYELRDFSRAVEICRSERQAFGKDYSCELFSTLGPFYVSSRCGSIPKENLIELIKLSGGKIAEFRKRARCILSDANRTFENKVYITSHWIVDSITHMQLQSFAKYSTMSSKTNPLSGKQQQLSTASEPATYWDPYSQI